MGPFTLHSRLHRKKALKQSAHIDYIAVYRARQRFFCDWSSIYTGQCLIGGAQGSPTLLARWVLLLASRDEEMKKAGVWLCDVSASVGLVSVCFKVNWMWVSATVSVGLVCVCFHTLMCVCSKVLTMRTWCVQCKVVYVNKSDFPHLIGVDNTGKAKGRKGQGRKQTQLNPCPKNTILQIIKPKETYIQQNTKSKRQT